jgi:hypothetical protein
MGDAHAVEGPKEVFICNLATDGVIEHQAGVFVGGGGGRETGAILEVVGLEINHPSTIRTLRRNGYMPS